MIKVKNKLFVGDESDCFYETKSNWAVVHACKHPCHQKSVGYRGNLNRNHPNYLILERGKHLFLENEYRNKKMSIQLKNCAFNWFKQKNVKYVKISVHHFNEHAHDIYKNWGFFDYLREMQIDLSNWIKVDQT